MNEEKLNEILKNFHLPTYGEIPDVGLYLEQVVKYINSFLTDFPEMHVTSSMISNYVKLKIITSPHKKTYSRNQIGALIFIVCVKTVLSMDHIRECLRMVPTFESYKEAYEFFRVKMLWVMDSFRETSDDLVRTSANETESALENIVIAVAHKMYLERYFELREQAQLNREDA